MTIAVHHGDCIEVMRKFADDSVDSVICDPPYGLTAGGEGGFMGKEWDGLGVGAQQQEWHRQWAVEALRVLKPGGHLLAFGGTRTYHRLACALEDAGFEIKDAFESAGGRFSALQWVYGSGFPKSMDVSKAIDKKLGAEREVVGYDASRARPNRKYEGGALGNIGGTGKASDRTDNGATITAPGTPEAATWEGWGTALKPAHEIVVVGQKAWTVSTLLATIGSCLSSLSASVAVLPSASRPAAPPGAKGASAPAPAPMQGGTIPAGPTTPTGAEAGSCAPMAMSLSVSVPDTSLSIVRSWQHSLGVLSEAMNTSTTATDNAAITDLKTLLSCLFRITPENIIEAAIRPAGDPAPACRAEASFSAVLSKWTAIHTLSALASATGKERTEHRDAGGAGSATEHEPIVLARKPLVGTVASNVLRYGTGALNIDGCRVGTDDNLNGGAYSAGASERHDGTENWRMKRGAQGNAGEYKPPSGRWPPNLLLTHAQECGPEGCTPGCPVAALDAQAGGNVSRFFPTFAWEKDDFFPLFYCKKADKKEKEAGCEGLAPQQQDTSRKAGDPGGDNPRNRGAKKRGNAHPTVKPLTLVRWMVRLVTPKDGLILDPFAGSGTTGIAALQEGVYCILIEKEAEYIPIIHARLSYARQQLESEEA